MALKPKNCINFKSRQLARQLTRHYNAELGKAGLKATQFSLLCKVLRLGPIAAGDLARDMELDASTLSRNMKSLLEANWLELSTGDDGRHRIVTITPAGRKKQAEADRHWAVAQQNINAHLGEQRASALTALLDECIARLREK